MNPSGLESKRALYIADISRGATNGMSQRSHQVLVALSAEFEGRLDILSINASPGEVDQWLRTLNVKGCALSGVFPRLARFNARLWYIFGVLFCCKARLFRNFPFSIVTPLPRYLADRYTKIVCYYPWAFLLLGLRRYAAKVIADLGDVMAERHKRVGVRQWISLYPRDERSILESGARVIVVSQFDSDEFSKLYGKKLQVIPIVPPQFDELITIAGRELPRRLGYIGARSYFNHEALRGLARPEFLGALQTADVELVIAGQICSSADPAIIAALKAGGARVIGEIGSLIEFYEQIGALINPTGPSSGLKVKSVETLLAGRSLITSKWGTDALLDDAFGNQIVQLDWPIDPAVLAKSAIEALNCLPSDGQNRARRFVEGAQNNLRVLMRN